MEDEKTTPDGQTWKRMRFRQNKVWMAVTPDGKPMVNDGKVLIKYQLNQDYEYRVHESTVQPLPRGEEVQTSVTRGGKKEPARKKPPKPSAPPEPGHDEPDLKNAICIYTDGAASGNPGPAGIGVFLRYGTHEKKISRSIGNATNNIAELMAIKTGLMEIKNRRLPIRLFTDSSYAIGVLTKGWRPQKNVELVDSIKDLLKTFQDVKLIKVKGHAGHAENEIADALATAGIKKAP